LNPEPIDVVKLIPLDEIIPDPGQPRKFFDEVEEQGITESIQQYGLIQPILVRPNNHSTSSYTIVCGERRYRAHKRLGLGAIKTIIREMEDPEVMDLQLLENIQRKDLSDIELAWEFKKREDRGQTHHEIADFIGKNRSYVSQRLSLLSLSDSDQQRMLRGELGFSQARVLVSVKDPEERKTHSMNVDKNKTVKTLQLEINGESAKMVTRVTKSHVNVECLAVIKFLSKEDGSLKKLVSRSQLIAALIEDIKILS